MLSTEEPYTQLNTNKPLLMQNCEDLVNKVLNCPTCKKLMIEKLNLDNNVINNIFKNNDLKELTILILIGLIVIILLDLFIKIVK